MKPKDKCIYPGQGVVEVRRIETKQVGDKRREYYILHTGSGMTIMCPKDGADALGVRPIATEAHAREVLQSLTSRTPVEATTWNLRYRAYMERLKTGALTEIAGVYRDLLVMRASKDLSFGERKMLDYARDLMTPELALALGVSDSRAARMVEDCFEDLGRDAYAG